MSEVKENLRYSEEHEWAEAVEGKTVRVGITDHAQCLLGDIVFVETPEVGAGVYAGESMGSIESIKTVSELYSPVTGKVTRVNASLVDRPEQVNRDPYGEGWIVEIEVEGDLEAELGKLMTADRYRQIVD
ncbi:glycine cleavage system protein GcvH [Cohnella caldifontis]|uniref:glycine cleavage system protein GcvH n=1 Tax=Cohnella caldifontis TaxID=3027471 RepID=UPI0023EC0AE3|nr:glycine cleavage system protein GcvH [Cohnella sp. YIM B05605]